MTIRKKARYVDIDKCTGCGAVLERRAPRRRPPASSTTGMGNRTAIYMPFPQAVPARPVIDKNACIKLTQGQVRRCARRSARPARSASTTRTRSSPKRSARSSSPPATSSTASAKSRTTPKLSGYGEYGYGKYKDVIDSLQFERLVSASGPTGGEIQATVRRRRCPRRSCSSVASARATTPRAFPTARRSAACTPPSTPCSTSTRCTTAQAHVFYMDIRAGGKNYDEFVRRAIEQDGAQYHRGRVSKITEENGKLIVRGVDTLAGEPLTIEADLVVLAAAMRPADGVEELAQKLNVGYDEFGFLSESHPKLRPVETNAAGVFVCGACQGPKDIPESVAQASAAAGKVLVHVQPRRADPRAGNRHGQRARPARPASPACGPARTHAIEQAEIRDRKGNLVKRTARVNPGLCMGCGTCVAVCPSKSADLEGFSEQQIYAMVESLV